jgi:hypothetical protein
MKNDNITKIMRFARNEQSRVSVVIRVVDVYHNEAGEAQTRRMDGTKIAAVEDGVAIMYDELPEAILRQEPLIIDVIDDDTQQILLNIVEDLNK